MTVLPVLRTARLTLRPFELADASAVQRLAGAYEVALNTLTVPHPYPDGAAEEWIRKQQEELEAGRLQNFAVADACGLVGSMGLMARGEGVAEIGYWIGVPFWRRGYASEAAAELLRYGFEDVGLHRIFGEHYSRNPASGRVLQKLGMQLEGTLREHHHKWGEFLDVVVYGILRREWAAG
jgi:RimJ/RimL family protein N-acetyltransferase